MSLLPNSRCRRADRRPRVSVRRRWPTLATLAVAAAALAVPSAVADAPTLSGVPSDQTVQATDLSGAVVSWPDPTATDGEGNATSVACSPASGSTFPIGTTVVSCTATDTVTSEVSPAQTFNVTVLPLPGPSVSVPGNLSAEATSASGVAVTYSASASDPLDSNPSLSCSPASGKTFPLGQSTVTCTATDSFGLSSNGSVTVTVVDTTAPTISVPASLQVAATSPSGAVASYSVSASDLVDGSVTPSCAPASGSTFPIGATTVNCSASDSHGNSSSASFTLSVVDKNAPKFSGVPSEIKVEAEGPTGAVVNYPVPTAVGLGQPAPVSCRPTPGATFPLGTTTVTCGSSDAAGNQSSVSFRVTVVDTTPPVLKVPKPITLSSQQKQGVAKSDPTVTAFLAAASAKDAVDGAVPVANDAPATLPQGTTQITFSASDRAGNKAKAQSSITIVPQPEPPPEIKTTELDNVKRLRAQAGDGFVVLSWLLPNDADYVTITRSPGKQGAPQSVVYQGSGHRFRNTGLTDGLQYRYLVVSFDDAGDRSTGLSVHAIPELKLLVAPVNGETVRTPPLLRWHAVPHASYYNVQLYRVGGSGSEVGRKVLSKWPKGTQLHLLRSWTYASHRQTLAAGRYSWFVWPGFGARSAVRYGKLLGQSSFKYAPAHGAAQPPAA
jgi:hypothetical protein